jgi:molybdopterin/thiamine biosynthesis adenylyltransferase
VGKFTIADPDAFEVANFNRQYGATTFNLGRSKAEVMAEQALAVNPELDLRVFSEAVTADNVDEFFAGADLFVDGVDFFCVDARRLLFQEARRRGLWAVTAGPIGFSTAWLTFDPHGMRFEDYFDLRADMDELDCLVSFAVGLAPRATHLPYLDLRRVRLDSGAGPSAALACQLAAGVVGAEVLKILLGRGSLRPAPNYFQFDAYRQILRRGRIPGGNRNPWQRFKRHWLKRRVTRQLQSAAGA